MDGFAGPPRQLDPFQPAPDVPTEPEVKIRPWRRIGGLTLIGVSLIVGGILATQRVINSRASTGPTKTDASQRYTAQSAPLNDLSRSLKTGSTQTGALIVNGRLNVSSPTTVASDVTIQGNVSVNGNGTFGGTLTAANFVGGGSGITGVNAALLNGQPGSYYVNLSAGLGALSANAALRNTTNAFTSPNTFTVGLNSAGISDSGALTVSGLSTLGSTNISSLTLGSPLSVTSGGTGIADVPVASVLFGQGGPTLGIATPAAAGLCLLSGATDVQWGSCSGAGTGVATLDGMTGLLTINNSTGSGSAITINNAKADSATKGIAAFNGTNFSDNVSGVINTIQDIATTSAPTFGQLSLSSSQAVAPMLLVNNTNGGATGNLVDLKLAGTSKFSVTPAGNATVAGAITSGTINGQTISNAAAFTGTLGVTGLASLNGGATVVGTLIANTITPSAAMTVGAIGQALTLQGNASTSLTATGGGFTTTVAFTGSPTGAVTYNFDRTPTAGAYTICSTAGNCAGVGGGVTTSGGATNRLAKFTASQGIGNSSITDTGTSVTLTPSSDSASVFQVQNAAGRSLLNVDTSGNKIALGNITATAGQGVIGALVLADGTADNFGVTFSPAALTANRTITVPNAAGTIAVSATGPIQVDAAGNISCPTCLTSGGGGGSAGVSSVDGLTGALAIANTSGTGTTITINSAKADGSTLGIAAFNSTNLTDNGAGVINTIQDITTTSAPTFGQLTLTASQAANPMLLVNNTNVGATGNLIDLQLNSVSKFSVAPSGGVTAGQINGQTISSSANFTGSLTVGTTLTTNTLSPTAGLTVGAAGQSFTLQGNGSSSITATASGKTTTVAFQAPAANVTYNFDTVAAGTYDICTTAGNCAGVGGGVTTTGGTVGTLPVFTAAQGIGDSLVSESGATVTTNGNLSLTSGHTYQINGTQITSAALANDSNLAKLDASQAFTGNTLTFENAANSATAFLVQNAGAQNVLSVDTSGNQVVLGVAGTMAGALVFNNSSNAHTTTLVANAAAGQSQTITIPASSATTDTICLQTLANCAGAGSVTSIDGLAGALNINNSSGVGSAITIDNAKADGATKGIATFNSTNFSDNGSGVINTIQDIATTSSPTFSAVNTNTVTPTGAFTLGATGQAFTLQGTSSSAIIANGGGFATTVGFSGSPAGTVTYNFDRAATAGTYTICTSATSSCSGAGSGYIVNGTSTQTGNFNIQSAAATSVGAVIQGATSQTADLLDARDSTGANVLKMDAGGNQETTGYFDNGIGGIGQFQNLIKYSEQFDNAAWTKSGGTSATADQSAAPDGQTTADTVHTTTSGGNLTQVYNSAGNNTYTFSVWLKTAASTQNVDLRIDSNGTPATGTAKTVTATTTWQRFYVTQTFASGVSTVTPTIFPGTASGTDAQTVYAWGAQLVQASNPEVYSRTTAATIAASAGVVSNGGLLAVSQNASDTPLIVQGAPSQSGNLLLAKSSTGSSLAAINNGGNFFTASSVDTYGATALTLGNQDATAINLGNTSSNIATTINGTAVVKPTIGNDSATAFQVQNAAGTPYLSVDTIDGRVGVGTSGTPAALLSIGGTTGNLQVDGSGNITVGGAATWSTSSGNLTIQAAGTSTLAFDTGGAGSITVGATNATSIVLGGNTSGTITGKVANSSSTAFVLQTAGGTAYFTADTTDERLYVGPTAGDTTGALLVLGNKTNSGDPTGVAGGMYYNSSIGRFRCYENSAWKNCIGIDADDQREQPFYSTDFMSIDQQGTTPFKGENFPVSNGGVDGHLFANDTNHPGVDRLGSGTAANSGFARTTIASQSQHGYQELLIGGGESFELVFRLDIADANTQDYMGYIDSDDGTAPANGLYFSMSGTTLKANATAASTTTSSTITTSMNTTDWYRVRLVVNSSASSVTYSLWDDTTGGAATTATISTNLPTASGDGTSCGVEASYAAASATNLIDLDYMSMWLNGRNLNR